MKKIKDRPLYNDADMKLRDEMRANVKLRQKTDKTGFKGFITEAEFMSRRKLGLPCDGYFLASEIRKLARQKDMNEFLARADEKKTKHSDTGETDGK